eukprot:6482355-Amphidinium_carterae.1
MDLGATVDFEWCAQRLRSLPMLSVACQTPVLAVTTFLITTTSWPHAESVAHSAREAKNDNQYTPNTNYYLIYSKNNSD